MQYLNTLLSLLSRTDTRDKVLRLVQYATLHSQQHQYKSTTYNVYTQVRRTRRWLRFLRSFELYMQLKRNIVQLKQNRKPLHILTKLLAILETISTILFYYFDHRVCLGQLQLLPKTSVVQYQPKSMRMYLLQNLLGATKNILQIIIVTHDGSLTSQPLSPAQGLALIKSKTIQFARNLLDILIAYYYLYKPTNSAAKVGLVGMLTSLIAIAQSLKLV